MLKSFFEKIARIGNRSISDNLFKSEKVRHKLGENYKNKPFFKQKISQFKNVQDINQLYGVYTNNNFEIRYAIDPWFSFCAYF